MDAQGSVVASPAPLPNWIWTGLVGLITLALAGIMAAGFAAAAGVVVARLTAPRKPPLAA